MKVLVTGAAGYIGSVTTALLLEAGHEVIALDNLSEGHRDALPDSVKLIQADVADLGNAIAKKDHIDIVVHLASYIAAGESMVNPEKYWHNNTMATLNMLDGLRGADIKKLIFASTAAVYGNPQTIPITEDAPTKPTNTYGMTKLAMDMAITSECIAHGLAATSVRFFNVAGAYGEVGERHNQESHIIPLALRALANNKPFTIFGDDYPTPDGTCIRDYIHVADLARAMMLAFDKLEPGKHTIYNLGSGNGFSNKEVAKTIEKVTGRKLEVVIGPRREGDPAKLIASSELARRELGWVPERPKLADMVGDAWEFFQKLQ